jgi:hypothetical protein
VVGMVNQTNVWRLYNVSAGQLLEIPAGGHKQLKGVLPASLYVPGIVRSMTYCADA